MLIRTTIKEPSPGGVYAGIIECLDGIPQYKGSPYHSVG